MASFKDTFEPDTFEANTFAAGTWRGKGLSAAVFTSIRIAIEGPQTLPVDITGSQVRRYALSDDNGRLSLSGAQTRPYRPEGPQTARINFEV